MHRDSALVFRPVIALRGSLLAVAVVALLVAPAQGAETMGYQLPDDALVDIIDAPSTPAVVLTPDNRWLLVAERPNLPSIAELSERELRLGGLRINPRLNAPSRSRPLAGLELVRIADGETVAVSGLPAEPRIENLTFSPDGSRLAFTHRADEGLELWVLELPDAQAGTPRARRVLGPRLSLTAGAGPRWLDDGSLAVALVPDGRGPEPPAPQVPAGPVIRDHAGGEAPARTYQDLLASPHDEALFEHYLTAQLARVNLHGEVTPLGEPRMLWSFEPSPDGRFLVVEALHRPFSYLVPADRFPRTIEVWDRAGRVAHALADLPLQEAVPIAFGSVPTGPRSVTWRDDQPATLFWVEALDGGDAGAEADERDALYLLAAPFDGEARQLARLGLRFGGAQWSSDELALLYEWWWQSRRLRSWIVAPGKAEEAPVQLFDRSFEDRYSDPGNVVTVPNQWGRPVVATAADGRTLFLIGDGASPEGDRPFLDALDLESRDSRRLFHSEAPYYERPWRLLLGDGDEAGRRFLFTREAVDEPPNYFLRDPDAESERQITHFPHPTPQLTGISKELIRYPRADGVELTATLYLPAGYEPQRDGPLPTMVWAYPVEFKSADAAGQVTDSPYRFARVGWWSPLLWLTQGYAVVDNPSMPIIGEGEVEPNDTYVQQLVASAQAAVDEVVRRGVATPGHLAIGGHSYGAFMAANLLAHSDLFAAGIARSGAYNRTLTPFGFQAEERTLWQAPEVYFTMSPFMHAEEINEPLLLIHGDADNNSGTYPMQSERFYNALKGLGATARLVMLPHESHGYQARESVLHMLWETERWLEMYVAGDGEATAASAPATTGDAPAGAHP
jgi:dipeptidyl aminopeptidase/acylaminoacyl peptidase